MARSIDQIVGELNSVYQPQIEQVNTQLAQLPQYYAAQTQGLGVAKDNAFRDITGAASAKGMLYSGMPIAEQTRYTGEKYLPALAQLEQQKNQQTFGFQSQLNDIYGKRMSQAQALQQAELDREEQARQAEANRQAQLQAARMQAARSYGGGGRSGGSAASNKQAAIAGMANALRGAAGRDGYVSPETWRQALGDWTAQGYGTNEFNQAFRNYANMSYGGASAGGDYGLKR